MRYIVMKHNQHELPRLQSFAAENGFDLVTVRGLSIIDSENCQQREFIPELKQYQSYQYEDGKRVKRHDYVCMHAFCFPAVFADGTVVLCDQDFNASQAYGQIGNGVTFGDLWFGKKAKASREVIRSARETFSFCANCPYADQSSNTCSFRLLWPNRDKTKSDL